MLTQRRWRAIGLITLTGAGAMAVGGVWVNAADSRLFFAIYWTIFLGLLLTTLYMVLLDLRYIRVLYTSGKREIYKETLGNEEFRRVLQQGTARAQDSSPHASTPSSKDGSHR